MTRRTADGGRAQVIATARQLFRERGFHQTAMADLSERAGVSVGQIYRLFPNKGEMISAIIAEDTKAQFERLLAIQNCLASGGCDVRGAFRMIVFDALRQGEEAPTYEILAEGFRSPVVGRMIGDYCDRLRTILGEIIMVAEPEIARARLRASEDMLLAILFGMNNRSLSRPLLSAEETADHTADMILAMLRRA